MATKKQTKLSAKKAKKQRIIIAVGGVLLLGILIFQGPKMLKLVHGGSDSTAAPYSALPAGMLATPAAAEVAVTSSGALVLPDRELQAQASEGQLVDFELFSSKDPFVQQVKQQLAGGPSSDLGMTGETGEAQTGGDGVQGQPTQDQGQPDEAAPLSAVISVNGTEETVQVGDEFPVADPAFVLVSATISSVKLGIAGGSLATGDHTVTLRRGKLLTLVNTIDGTEYRLRLGSSS
jgi:hypothetical protein